MTKRISMLVERKLDFTPDVIVAVSTDRSVLIDRARERNLHIDARRLDVRGAAKIDEFTQASIEEIDMIAAHDAPPTTGDCS